MSVLEASRWVDPSLAHRVLVREPAPAGLARVDYVDAFAARLAPEEQRPAEELLRTAFAGTSVAVRLIIHAAWRSLGFDLAAASSDAHVAGWEVVSSSPGSVEIAAEGPRTAARIVLRLNGREAVTTTFVEHRSRSSALLWWLLSPVHRRVALYLIDRAQAA